MENIVLKLLDNWHLIIFLFFFNQFLKLSLNVFLKAYEVKHLNKNSIKLASTGQSNIIEIQSSNLKIEDLNKLSKSEFLINSRIKDIA